MAAMLFFPYQLCVLLLLSLASSLCRRTALAQLAVLHPCLLFDVLTVNLSEDLLDAWVGIGVDKVAEQVGQPEQVSKSSNGVILLRFASSQLHVQRVQDW
jgi:hypothetical protein